VEWRYDCPDQGVPVGVGGEGRQVADGGGRHLCHLYPTVACSTTYNRASLRTVSADFTIGAGIADLSL
jgi:hypothetical protein